MRDYQDAEELRKALFVFVKQQDVSRREAGLTMEGRVITANEKSLRREHNRQIKREEDETGPAESDQEMDRFDPFDHDTSLSWIVENEIQPLDEKSIQ